MKNHADILKIDSNDAITEIVIFQNVVYLAGQVPDDDQLDIIGQSQQVFANIDKALAQAGTDKSRLLSAQILLRDLTDFEQFNQQWKQWLQGCTPPARASLQAHLVNPNWRIEIMVTAAMPM